MGSFLKTIEGFNPKYGINLIKNLYKLFGKKYILLMTTMFFTQDAVMGDLVRNGEFPYYNEAGVDVQMRAEMNIISSSPDNFKALIGLLTDLIPIGGKKKLYYVWFFLIVGLICTLILGSLPLSVAKENPIIAAFLFFGMHLNADATDVLFEAKNVELMQKNPQVKSDLFAYAWTLDTLGTLLPNIFVGIITEKLNVRLIFFIFFPIMLAPIPFLLMGGLIQDDSRKFKGIIDLSILLPQWKIVVVAFVQFLTSVISMFVTWFFNDSIQLIYGLATGLLVVICVYILLDLRTANFYCYLVVSSALYADVDSAIQYFYHDSECVEGGPAFSYIIINTIAPIINSINQFIAILVFQVVFYNWKFHNVFYLMITIRGLTTFFDLAIILRWSKSEGISDEFLYLFGSTTIGMLAQRINHFVNSYMNAKLCPKYLEATMYAMLSSSSYVGVIASKFIGLFSTNAFGIVSNYEPENGIYCNYDKLWILVLIAHLLLPLLTYPLIYFLVPNIRLNELLIHDQDKTQENSKATSTKTYLEEPY